MNRLHPVFTGLLGLMTLSVATDLARASLININSNFRPTTATLSQAGYTNLDGASSTSSGTTTWTNVDSTPVDVTITTSTGEIGFRERGVMTSPAPFVGMENFLRTLVKSQQTVIVGLDELRLSFADLPLGQYVLTTYHHDVNGGDSNAPFSVYTDLANTNSFTLFSSGNVASVGTNPASITTVTIPFTSTATTVHFDFRLTDITGKSIPEVVLNGFELVQIPEPSSLALLAFGMLAMFLFRRR